VFFSSSLAKANALGKARTERAVVPWAALDCHPVLDKSTGKIIKKTSEAVSCWVNRRASVAAVLNELD